ncbi:MAG: hypothetical protein NT074_08485 [Methanomicrobiales archaeon]|jgi:hypothetical protein|nr:hypothetical protein [Methanomicrobiales archaeon]
MVRSLFLVAILILVVASIAPAAAVPGDRYSYLTVNEVVVTLERGDAYIRVNYTIDEGARVILLLLGTQDIKGKILKILNFEDAELRSIDTTSAEVFVPDISYNYGRGVFWFPEHSFNIVIPHLTIISPQTSRELWVTSVFPEGMGYFAGDN